MYYTYIYIHTYIYIYIYTYKNIYILTAQGDARRRLSAFPSAAQPGDAARQVVEKYRDDVEGGRKRTFRVCGGDKETNLGHSYDLRMSFIPTGPHLYIVYMYI